MIGNETKTGPRLSCTCMMILGNVEPTIRDCMDSLLSSGCFDQYNLVLDARIKDRTAQILAGYRESYPQIKLLFHDWRHQDYAAARNVALKQAKTERLYWQDGDEILLDGPGIYSLLQKRDPVAYHIWQVSPVPFSDPISVHQLRLFPRLTGVKWELPVHEQVAFSLRGLGVQEILTPYRVWHHGYEDDAINTQKHIDRARIMGNWLRKHPKKDEKRAYMEQQYSSSIAYIQGLQRRIS